MRSADVGSYEQGRTRFLERLEVLGGCDQVASLHLDHKYWIFFTYKHVLLFRYSLWLRIMQFNLY